MLRVEMAPCKTFLFSEADGRKFSYEELLTAVNRAARLLASHGVGKGDVVSLLMPNSAEYIIAYFACWKLGAIAWPHKLIIEEAGDSICAFRLADQGVVSPSRVSGDH